MKRAISTLLLLSAAAFCGKRILIMGDSITQGSSATNEHPWRDWLMSKFSLAGLQYTAVGLGPSTRGFTGVGVCSDPTNPVSQEVALATYPGPHGAACGITTDGLLAWFRENKASFVSSGGADVVVIASGTNDIGLLGAPQMNRSSDQTLQNMDQLVKEVAATLPKSKIYVTTLLPVNLGLPAYQTKIDEYNGKLFGWAENLTKAGTPVTILNWSSAVSIKDLRDGLHPNSAGSEKLARLVFDRMELHPKATIATQLD